MFEKKLPVFADGRAGASDAKGLVDLVVRHGLKKVVGAVVGPWRERDRRIQPD